MLILHAQYKGELARLWNLMHEIVTSDPECEFLGSRLYGAHDGSSVMLYELGVFTR